VESISGNFFITHSHLLSCLDLIFNCCICQHPFSNNASKSYHESLCWLKCSPSSNFSCCYCGITFAVYYFSQLLDHKSRCSLNQNMQSASHVHVAKWESSFMSFGASKYSKLKNSSASFSGVEKHKEDRLSWQPRLKVQGSTATVVEDKMASAALIGKCSS
jgi:hypothetical protein